MASFRPGDTDSPAKRITGFDDSGDPPWVMVPEGEFRRVILTSGSGLSLRLKPVWDPYGKGVVTVVEQSTPGGAERPVVLTAVTPGTTVLEARNTGGLPQASLKITVKKEVTLSTFVHFVFEKSGRTTSWDLGRAKQMIESVNNILHYQANVQLVYRNSGAVHLPFDLPRGVPASMPQFSVPRNWEHATPGPLPCYSFQAPSQVGCEPPTGPGNWSRKEFDANLAGIRNFDILSNILSHVDPGSDYNMFCVERLDQPPGGFFTLAFTPSKLRTDVEINACILPQSSYSIPFAHELGHYLLRPSGGHSFTDRFGHSSGTYDLMQEHPGPGDPKATPPIPADIKIPEDQAHYMNGSGVKYVKF
jgi:hypothetical protein